MLIRVNSWLESSANGDHLPVGLIIVPEIVLLGFAIDHVDEELAQLLVARASAEWFHDIELEITAETGTQFSVARQPQLIAALAEMQIRHRADESDPLIATGDLVVSGRAVCSKCCFGNQVAEMSFNRALRFGDGQKILIAQDFSRADRHHLDKTQD